MDKSELPLNDSACLAELGEIAARFVHARNWERFHQPKNLAMSIAIEAAELMEHFQWVESHERPQTIASDSPIAEEIADVFAYVLCMSNALGLDLAEAFCRKMKKNELKYPVDRPFVVPPFQSKGPAAAE